MKTDKTIISLAIFSIFTFQRCTVFEDNQSQKIISQELTYDSINNKSKLFNVGLETTISYTTKDTNSIDFNNLTLIINNDKFTLVPVIESKKFDKETNTLKIKFRTKINFLSKTYKNDTLTNKVLGSKISNSDGKFIEKDDSFELKSLILGYPPNDKAPKYE
jgi:hypothetical protein